ncbi:MAG TPA: PQQ-binding-like beta-propeller repeat protein [Gemmataceae bacterium]|jgi:outer membrane protein assembly factor BamB
MRCAVLPALVFAIAAPAARADDWPQWLGPKRDSVWRETGVLQRFPAGGPKVLWRVPIDGGFSGPAVADGRVYVTDFVTAGDRSAPASDKRQKLPGKERVLCFSAADGKPVWKHEYDCEYYVSYDIGPRCTPAVAGGKVYTLGAMGNLLCLDATSGSVVWQKDLKKEYGIKAPLWGFAGHPLVDGQKLFVTVGGDGSVLVAFDKDTGKEIWRALSAKESGYCPPSMIRAGGVRQLVLWTSEDIASVDPDTGKEYWSVPLKPAYGMSITAPRRWHDYLFAGGIGFKAALVKLAADKPAATVVWEGKQSTAVYPVNSTPFIEDGIIYGVDQPGCLRAVKLETGERLWESYKPVAGKDLPTGTRFNSGTAFLVKNGDRFVIFSETGDLILARLSPKGYEEVSRANILAPTSPLPQFGRTVVWTHPAFANKCVYARNDKELVCVSLAAL